MAISLHFTAQIEAMRILLAVAMLLAHSVWVPLSIFVEMLPECAMGGKRKGLAIEGVRCTDCGASLRLGSLPKGVSLDKGLRVGVHTDVQFASGPPATVIKELSMSWSNTVRDSPHGRGATAGVLWVTIFKNIVTDGSEFGIHGECTCSRGHHELQGRAVPSMLWTDTVQCRTRIPI